jgi:hypothetical protein
MRAARQPALPEPPRLRALLSRLLAEAERPRP